MIKNIFQKTSLLQLFKYYIFCYVGISIRATYYSYHGIFDLEILLLDLHNLLKL